MDFLRSAAAIAFVFGLVIFIHELGHFLAAKLFGVYAPRFSIGFGKALWSRKWGETEYVLAQVPLGGYVRMASRDDETMAFVEGGGEQPVDAPGAARSRWWTPDGMAPFGPRPVPEDRWFESKSFFARFCILIAGVTMNILLGFVLFTGLAASLGRPVMATRTVGTVTPPAWAPQLSPALAEGDTIVAVGSVAVRTWDDIDYAIDTLPGDSLVIRTNRMAVTVPAGPVKGAKRRELINAVLPLLPPVIDAVIPGGPAEGAGLRDGDSVVAVNGAPVHSWQQVRSQIEGSPGRPMTLDVARGAARATITVTPEPTKQKDSAGGRDTLVGKIGAVARQPEEREPVSLTTAVRAGATETWFAAGLVVRSLQMLATGEASIRQLGGPVAIGGAAAQAARRGWEALLSLLALISINVAVFNLLPVPVLDGGQILLLAAERVKGSALSLRTREYLMRAGLAFIVLLLIVVMYNDVVSPIVRRLFKS